MEKLCKSNFVNVPYVYLRKRRENASVRTGFDPGRRSGLIRPGWNTGGLTSDNNISPRRII